MGAPSENYQGEAAKRFDPTSTSSPVVDLSQGNWVGCVRAPGGRLESVRIWEGNELSKTGIVEKICLSSNKPTSENPLQDVSAKFEPNNTNHITGADKKPPSAGDTGQKFPHELDPAGKIGARGEFFLQQHKRGRLSSAGHQAQKTQQSHPLDHKAPAGASLRDFVKAKRKWVQDVYNEYGLENEENDIYRAAGFAALPESGARKTRVDAPDPDFEHSVAKSLMEQKQISAGASRKLEPFQQTEPTLLEQKRPRQVHLHADRKNRGSSAGLYYSGTKNAVTQGDEAEISATASSEFSRTNSRTSATATSSANHDGGTRSAMMRRNQSDQVSAALNLSAADQVARTTPAVTKRPTSSKQLPAQEFSADLKPLSSSVTGKNKIATDVTKSSVAPFLSRTFDVNQNEIKYGPKSQHGVGVGEGSKTARRGRSDEEKENLLPQRQEENTFEGTLSDGSCLCVRKWVPTAEEKALIKAGAARGGKDPRSALR
ncbi:unnamed protein product [Amoebophrya sp. A120]|nr:unnamed protein product [Amoebophrya sp. A120]|eukprot:GSA120T00018766001.1